MKRQIIFLNYFFSLVVLMTSCNSVYVIQKSDQCSTPANKIFNNDDISEINDKLKEKLTADKFQLAKKETHLELIIKKKDQSKLNLFIDEYFNGPILEFKTLALKLNQEQKSIVELLKSRSDFNQFTNSRNARLGKSIVGYVNNEEDIKKINQDLKEQNIDLTNTNLYWFINPTERKPIKNKKYYLVATKKHSGKKLANINKYVNRIQVLLDMQYFEYSVRLYLNTNGIERYKDEIQAFNDVFFAVIIDQRISKIQRIKLRNENKVSLFGFKDFDQAVECGRKIKNRSSLVEIKKIN